MANGKILLVEGTDDEHVLKHICGNRDITPLDIKKSDGADKLIESLDPPAGTLLPRLGVWIMPDNQKSGTLEDFLRFLVPQPTILFDHVRNSVAAIPEGERRFKPLDEPKAIIHTWLAWQKEPGRPFGTAITARFLDPNVPEVDVLVAWLNRLFFPSGPK